MKRRDWTAPELATLLRMASTHKAKDIGAVIGRTGKAVRRFAERHKIRIAHQEKVKFSDLEVRAVRDMAARDVPRFRIAAGMRISRGHVSKLALRRLRKAA